MKSTFARKSAFAKRESRSGMIFTIPAALIMLGLVVYPMLYGFFISTQKSNLIDEWEFVGAKYYIQLLTDADFFGTLKTTATFAACVVIGNLFVGLLLAVLVNQKIPLMNIFKVILMLPWLFPEVVVALIWKWLFSPLFGMFNYVLFSLDLIEKEVDVLGQPGPAFAGVVFVCIWKGYPIVMLMMMAGMKNIPHERYEAAAIDGANKWQQFLNVTLPGLLPSFQNIDFSIFVDAAFFAAPIVRIGYLLCKIISSFVFWRIVFYLCSHRDHLFQMDEKKS